MILRLNKGIPEEISTGQIVFMAVMAVLLFIVIPMIQSRTGKSMSQLFFGISRKKEKQDDAGRERKTGSRGPKQCNGTKNDLTIFVSRLLRFANKHGMGVVAPGMVEHNGKTARLVAFLVAPSGVMGIYCLGFGGTITPGGESEPWKQYMNGQDLAFRNPLEAGREQYDLVRAAMDAIGFKGNLDIVTVFTNPRVSLTSVPSALIYTQKQFMEYLKHMDSLKQGNLDVKNTVRILGELVKIEDKKAGKKPPKQKQ